MTLVGTNTPQAPCAHCGLWHSGPCLRIKAIEYYPDGTVKRIEYVDTFLPMPQPVPQYNYVPGGFTEVPCSWITIWPPVSS